MSKPFDTEAGKAWSWWNRLRPHEANGWRGDRAALARLRRASSILEAMSEPATGDLYRSMGLHKRETDLPRAALLATVLAHVRDGSNKPIAQAIGTQRGDSDSQQLITPLRFKRLIAAREPDDILIAFRRAVAILGNTANVRDLARQLLAFTDPDDNRADIARTLFAFDYHGAGRYAPGNDADTDDNTDAATPAEA